MKNLIRTLTINTIVSTLAGLISAIYGNSFLYVFSFFFIIQYILYSVIVTLIVNFFREKTKQKELDKLENLSTILECSYCKTKNLLIFVPDQYEKSNFVCTSCEKENTVILQFTVARTTDEGPTIKSILINEDQK